MIQLVKLTLILTEINSVLTKISKKRSLKYNKGITVSILYNKTKISKKWNLKLKM